MDNHIPTYEPDDEQLTPAQIAMIQKLANVPENIQWSSSLFDMTEAEYREYTKHHHRGINAALDAYLDRI